MAWTSYDSLLQITTRPETNIEIITDKYGVQQSSYLPDPPDGHTYYDVLSHILHSNTFRNTWIHTGDYIATNLYWNTPSTAEYYNSYHYESTSYTPYTQTLKLIANVDTYFGFGNEDHIVGHHIDFISDRYVTSFMPRDELNSSGNGCPGVNTTNGARNGIAQPFLASTYGLERLKNFMDTYASLSNQLIEHMIPKYINAPIRGYSSTANTGSTYCYFGTTQSGMLWLPLAYEIGGAGAIYENANSGLQKYSYFTQNLRKMTYLPYPSSFGATYGALATAQQGSSRGWAYINSDGTIRGDAGNSAGLSGTADALLCFRFQ